MNQRQLRVEEVLKGTCQWIYGNPKYLKWISHKESGQHQNFLWVKGKAGSGKSTLMKNLIKHVGVENPLAIIVSFFFDARGTSLEKTPLGLYRTLLLELFAKVPNLLQEIDIALHQRLQMSVSDWEWREDELKDLLRSVLSSLRGRRVYIFVDALDECEEDNHTEHTRARDLVRFFEELLNRKTTQSPTMYLCLSSRHYPLITVRNCTRSLVLCMEEENSADITQYIEYWLRTGPPTSTLKDRELIQDIATRSNGVFLWAVLVVQKILISRDRGKSKAYLKTLLRETPVGLDPLFRQILQDVDAEDREDTVKLLQWALFSQVSLTLDELQHALAFHSETAPTSVAEWKTSEDYQTSSSFENRIRDLSRGLIELRKQKAETGRAPESYGIQFIHETVREFFSANDYRIPRQLHDRVVPNFEVYSHNLLMLSCLRYIAAKDLRRDTRLTSAGSIFTSDILDIQALSDARAEVLAHSAASSIIRKLTELEFNPTLRIRYPFFHYAVLNFSHHAKFGDCDSEEVRRFGLIDRLISDNGSLHNFIASAQYLLDPLSSLAGKDGLFRDGLLQFFARRGSRTCVSKLLDLGWNPNQLGRTPLQAACEGGHGDVAELLIDRGANVNSVHSHRLMLLRWDADVLRTLLARGLEVDRNILGSEDRPRPSGTMLHEASEQADWRKVEVLLEAGADMNARNFLGSTPLHLVHFPRVLKVLLDHGARTDLQDKYELTAQDYAEMREYGDLVQIFREHKYAQLLKTKAQG
jgi:ankyrin repeat protein